MKINNTVTRRTSISKERPQFSCKSIKFIFHGFLYLNHFQKSSHQDTQWIKHYRDDFFNQPARAMPSDLGSEAASTDPSMCLTTQPAWPIKLEFSDTNST